MYYVIWILVYLIDTAHTLSAYGPQIYKLHAKLIYLEKWNSVDSIYLYLCIKYKIQ